MSNSGLVVGLILARKGSKRFPGKNLAKLAGYTLIEWAIYAAKSAKCVDLVVLSTDYEKETFANLEGVIYRRRPPNLCSDDALSVDAITDAVSYIQEKFCAKINHVVLLEPPCPFRSGQLIDRVYELHTRANADSTVSLKLVEDSHPIRMKKLVDQYHVKPALDDFTEPATGLPAQKQPEFWLRDTAVYIFNADSLSSDKKNLYGRIQCGYRNNANTVNIDSDLEFRFAQFLLRGDFVSNEKLLVPEAIRDNV